MFDLNHGHSLTDFARNAKAHIDRLRASGQPEVLTVNGQAEVVVQSASSYQQLVEDAAFAQSLRVICRSMEEARNGEGQPIREFLRSLASKHEIDLP